MTGARPMTVRVCVTDVWDTVALAVTPAATVAEVKADALARATGRRVDPRVYAVKYRGGLVTDETQTLATLGVPDAAPLIVLPARRRPVR